jgi:prophage antirepressor-like protein
MTDLIPFHFESHSIRVHVDSQGEPWWVLTDVCNGLSIANPSDVTKRINQAYLKSVSFQEVMNGIDKSYMVENELYSPQNNRGMNATFLLVNEYGLYEVIFRSNKPEAKVFRQWVFEEVLPSIRKTGKYEVPAPTPSHQLPSPAERLAELRDFISFMDDLGLLTERDKLLAGDAARNATLATGPGLLGSPEAYGFSVAERVGQLGYHLSAREKASIFPRLGKRLIDEYRSRYGSEPGKESRYVDGATRLVAWYGADDASWVDPIVQSFLTSMGFTSRGVPA